VNHAAQATLAARLFWGLRAPLLVFAVFFFGGVVLSFLVSWVALLIYYFVDAYWLHRQTSPEIVMSLIPGSFLFLFPYVLIIEPLPQAIGAVVAAAAFAVMKRVPLGVVMIMVPVLGFLVSKASWMDDARPPAVGVAWREFLLYSALQLPVSLLCWLLARRLNQQAVA
jgi:hypothetical protein